jgi:predicted O-linked N-acetylglucosamine transferase (SPINDLY family)
MENKFQEAFELHKNGSLQEAKKIYEAILQTTPNDFNCLHHLGLIAKNNKEYLLALDLFSQAININPKNAAVHFNLANTLKELNKINDAIASYDKAIEIKPDYELYLLRGLAFYELEKFDEAVSSYDESIKLKPDPITYCNRGLALVDLNKIEVGIADYDNAIQMDSNFIQVRHNRGLALKLLGKTKECIEAFKAIVKIEPNNYESLYEIATIYNVLKEFKLALNFCGQVLKINPNHNPTILLGIKIRKRTCDWTSDEQDITYALKNINDGEESVGPFSSLAFFADPAIQKKLIERHTSKKYPPNNFFNKILPYKNHKKIRIAYFSPDFCDHPVSNLMVECIEKHDQSKFEIYGFSLVDKPDDPINKRLKKAFTKYINIENKLAKDIVRLAREMEIDISIDLAVYTGQTRPEIFAMRTAPIQINYLGFPGTSGADYYDYIIADSVLIPKDNQKHYSEKIVYLPSFQANDSNHPTPSTLFKRQDLGLPEKGFIFCCFNNSNKYNPSIFDSWIKILSKVNDSVLLLYADNESVKINLRKEITLRGIKPSRLIFGDRLPIPEYLARFKVIDLFLDTLPFNAGTTGSDALRTGLPILTCKGKSFAGRMCSSLLNAVNLPELITCSLEHYESLAIELATNPEQLKIIRDKLDKSLPTAPLYNSTLFTKNIECAYSMIYERMQNKFNVEHIIVE